MKYLKFRAFEEEVKEATNYILYKPEENYNGDDTIRIDVSDMGYTGIGGELNTSVSIPLKIRAVNTAPVIDCFDDTITVEEDEAFPLKKYKIAISDVDARPYDILSMTVSVVIGSIDCISQNEVLQGNITSLNEALASMRYIPLQNSNLVSNGRFFNSYIFKYSKVIVILFSPKKDEMKFKSL